MIAQRNGHRLVGNRRQMMDYYIATLLLALGRTNHDYNFAKDNDSRGWFSERGAAVNQLAKDLFFIAITMNGVVKGYAEL